jgi:hypothetical protein
MSTKQLRLNDAHQIQSRIGEFLGKKINLVLIDNTVMFGVLKNVSAVGITLMNMRLKKIKYTFDSIAEVYLDTIV